MTFDKETAARLESLYRQHLVEAFQETFTFDSITVGQSHDTFDQDAFHVYVVYHGDGRLLDPAKLNRISSLMVDKAAELGIENTIIESYVDSQEYDGDLDRVEEPLEEISGDQNWHGMLNVAKRVLNTEGVPDDAVLSLGVERSYFAMYHALCYNNARALAGSPRQPHPYDWSRVYMGMDEGTITERLRQYRPQASDTVNDFGAAFAVLQEHRDRAMEPPTSVFHPSEVIRLIQRAQSAILALEAVSNEDRRSLAINLLVGKMPDKNPARIPTA